MCVRRLQVWFASLVWLFLVLVPTARAQSLMTSASGVRLRSEPRADARLISELPLGAEIVRCGDVVDGWVRVETKDGRAGFVLASLVIALPPSGGGEAIDDLVRARLRRTTDSLAHKMELAAFVERLVPAPPVTTLGPDRASRLEYFKLKAWSAVLEALPFGADPGDVGRAWLTPRTRHFVYDDSRGRYILRPEIIRQAHDRHQRGKSAEDLLWLLVSNGFAGECEGQLACYIGRTDAAEGLYLRLYPEGRHVEVAMRRILERAAWWKSRVETRFGFDPAAECKDITPVLGTLRFGLESARHPDRAKAVALVDEIRWRCQQGASAGS